MGRPQKQRLEPQEADQVRDLIRRARALRGFTNAQIAKVLGRPPRWTEVVLNGPSGIEPSSGYGLLHAALRLVVLPDGPKERRWRSDAARLYESLAKQYEYLRPKYGELPRIVPSMYVPEDETLEFGRALEAFLSSRGVVLLAKTCEEFLTQPAIDFGSEVDYRSAARIVLQRKISANIEFGVTIRKKTLGEIIERDKNGLITSARELDAHVEITTVEPAQFLASIELMDDAFQYTRERRQEEQAEQEKAEQEKLSRHSARNRAAK